MKIWTGNHCRSVDEKCRLIAVKMEENKVVENTFWKQKWGRVGLLGYGE